MIETVAVGTDGSDTAAKAVEFAMDLASRYVAKIVFLSAYRGVPDERLKREARDAPEDIERERGLTAASEAKEGEASKVLVELADKHDADILVMGNKGMQRKVLGS